MTSHVIKAFVGIAVDAKGDWLAVGYPDQDGPEAARTAVRQLIECCDPGKPTHDILRGYWKEVEIPVPEDACELPGRDEVRPQVPAISGADEESDDDRWYSKCRELEQENKKLKKFLVDKTVEQVDVAFGAGKWAMYRKVAMEYIAQHGPSPIAPICAILGKNQGAVYAALRDCPLFTYDDDRIWHLSDDLGVPLATKFGYATQTIRVNETETKTRSVEVTTQKSAIAVAIGLSRKTVQRIKQHGDAVPKINGHSHQEPTDECLSVVAEQVQEITEENALREMVRDVIASSPGMMLTVDDICDRVGMGAAACLNDDEQRPMRERLFRRHGSHWTIAD